MVTIERHINTITVRVNGKIYCIFPLYGPIVLGDVLASLA